MIVKTNITFFMNTVYYILYILLSCGLLLFLFLRYLIAYFYVSVHCFMFVVAVVCCWMFKVTDCKNFSIVSFYHKCADHVNL